MTQPNFARTRKLSMTQLNEVSKWLDHNVKGKCDIRGIGHRKYIQQYCAEHDGNRKIHDVKVNFTLEEDARHFLMEWG